MGHDDDYEFFGLRKQSKTYITKVFTFGAHTDERVRNVRMVLEGSDEVLFGEVEGALCLRLTGGVRKNQVTALVTQDNKNVRRVTLQTFKTRASRGASWIETFEKDEFAFRQDEFERLVRFLTRIEFIDFSNQETFQIEDISTGHGPKAIIDAEDRDLVRRLRSLRPEQRMRTLDALRAELSPEEVNVLLGRRRGLSEFEDHMTRNDWDEVQWQDFFEREQWVFGYGLDYRIMRQFGREMTIGTGGSDNRNRPVIDFLSTFKDYTVLVEIKRPDTGIFRPRQGGRAGTWDFSRGFVAAVSQILEQKAEWASFAESGTHYSRQTGVALAARTRNAKAILVVGSRDEFVREQPEREADVRRDTFELFRRETRGIDIITFDELLERARFITRDL